MLSDNLKYFNILMNKKYFIFFISSIEISILIKVNPRSLL